jgi:hypothetical protein
LRRVSKDGPHALVAYPSRLAASGEHLRMTAAGAVDKSGVISL